MMILRTFKKNHWIKSAIASVFMYSMFSFSTVAQVSSVDVRYDAPRDQKLAPHANLLKSERLLDDMAKQIGSQVKLPKTLTLVGKQCDQVNALVKGFVGGEAHDSYVIRVHKNQTLQVQISWKQVGDLTAYFVVTILNS